MKNRGMQKFLKQGLVLIAMAVLLLPLNGYAEIYEIDSDDAPCEALLWDITGSYSDELYGCEGTLDISQDAKGKITGGGSADCDDVEIEIEGASISVNLNLDWVVTGSIKKKGDATEVSISVKVSGTLDVPAANVSGAKVSGTEKITADIDPDNQTIVGTADVKVSIKGLESITLKDIDFYEDLPVDMDGSWELDIDVTGDVKKMLGNGQMWLSNGDILPFSAQGSYKEKTDETTFTLKGFDASKGCNLKPVIYEETGDVTTLTGKVLGQSIKCK